MQCVIILYLTIACVMNKETKQTHVHVSDRLLYRPQQSSPNMQIAVYYKTAIT